ncbi:hypothetical protein FKM82_006622 [Ascaphus truei]
MRKYMGQSLTLGINFGIVLHALLTSVTGDFPGLGDSPVQKKKSNNEREKALGCSNSSKNSGLLSIRYKASSQIVASRNGLYE